MIASNPHRYLASLSAELQSQSTRVRDLIGNAHWLSDGHHKEHILHDVIKRHLPNGYISGRGFVLSAADHRICSKEQDILIVDNSTEAPLFKQGELLISFPEMVRATLSVKTTMESATIADSIKGLNSVRNAAADGHRHPIWCGAFFYELDNTLEHNPAKAYGYCADGMRSSRPRQNIVTTDHPTPNGPDFMASSHRLAFKFNYSYTDNEPQSISSRILGFDCGNLAAALFIAALLDHLAYCRDHTRAEFSHFSGHSTVTPLQPPVCSFESPSVNPPNESRWGRQAETE